MIRIAATADLHFGRDSRGILRPNLERLPEEADVLLIGGDLTRFGEVEEARILARELRDLPVPVVAVLGNHDYHSGVQDRVRAQLERSGVRVVEGDVVDVEVPGGVVSVAGTKGFGGGFPGASGSDFGEPEMKAFIGHTKTLAQQLEEALRSARGDVRVALLHYSPVRDTLVGEPPEIFPFLGSYLLAEAIDRAGADLALHGHAHRGVEKGATPGGVLVRNVAQPVLQRAYAVYQLERERVPSSARRAPAG